MAVTTTRPSVVPVKLPEAPSKYDKEDQDRTRRMIEHAIMQFGFGITRLSSLIVPVAQDQDFLPVSPIHGTVVALGTASFAALCQLLNPATSGKIIVVYHVDIDYDSALTPAANIMRVTEDPQTITLGNTGFLQHRDARDTSTITSTLLGGTGTVNLGRGSGSWEMALANIATRPAPERPFGIIREGEMPLILLPGQALEVTNVRVATDSFQMMHVVFDELPLTTSVGQNLPNFTGPRSSCVGFTETSDTITSVSGALTVVQLFNPGPFTLKVTGLYVVPRVTIFTVSGGDPTKFFRVRRTSEPLTLGGTITSVLVRRLDRRSTVPITATLKLSTNGGTVLFPNSFFFDELTPPINQSPLPWTARIIQPFGAPIFVKPGSAIEVASLSESAAQGGNPMGVGFLWDEI